MDLTKILDRTLDKDFVVQLFKEQKEVFDAGVTLALKNEQPMSWRATWILKHSIQKNDTRIQYFIDDFIELIPKTNNSQQRETLNILLKMKLDDEQEGKLFDVCMGLWENITKPAAVRYLSFKFIFNVCEKYPELKGELDFICQEQYLENISPGIKKGIDKMIKERS